ncbi:COG3497 Phage tail sheath protein FI [uncultured Caudovirales phage]|uniref:COG3497 Phage tail sheath protein FI n=1 Tax=uncultured Caudovirales phage TaxID=2100421 RepID=A0A6J5PQU8_9CAUD|nr:COG3497 Phage tail sheath protein FI [uncultured Caudovirales phage]CAB4179735.1 COG3497 Phage tail sheath protein FI [uncultured Caudovirales phage]CAB4188851.1 COG3497 Phage tail sheath protein FI [uncultured Caudovirales phage]
MAFQRPGVYVQETLSPTSSTTGPDSDTVAAFIGANDRGPLTPTKVTSWGEYVNYFGAWNTSASNALPTAVSLFFSNGGGVAYVTRVVKTAVLATRTLSDRAGSPLATLKVDAKNKGTWGNGINVSVSDSLTTDKFDLTVYYGGSTDGYRVEKFVDLSMVTTDPRYAVTAINATSMYITVTDLASATTGATKNPSVVTNQALTSGTNGAAITNTEISAALALYDVVTNSLVLNLPGYTDATIVNSAISYADGRGDAFVVIDGADDTVSAELALAATYTVTSAAAVYYPQITIPDPALPLGSATGMTTHVGAGGAVVGLYLATDASRGVFKAPAGLQARIAGAVSVPKLTNAELDSLNSASAAVNVLKYIPGSGIVVMGSRTLKLGYVDRYVPVRRTLIYLRKTLTDLTEFAVFEPNDANLWRRLDTTISAVLTNFWSQGGLRGATPAEAFFVRVDGTNNSQATIDNGEVHIEVGVALQRPAEFVVIKIGQYDGGTTVTVA